MIFQKIKPLMWLAIGSVLFSIATTVIWFTVNNSHDGFTVGMITNVEDGIYTIVDPRQGAVKVETTATTRIKYLRNDDTILSVGDFVQVNGDFGDGVIEANSIRVMHPPKNTPPPPNIERHDGS